MRGIRLYAIVAAAFMAGAFIASPELRAYAANTVGSADIINNSILSADIKDAEVKTVDLGGSAVTSAKIKDGEIKTADIATGAVAAGRIADGAVGTLKIADDSITAADIQADAVGASEIAGVTKLIFAECFLSSGTISPGNVFSTSCPISGVDSTDKAVASLENNVSCFAITNILTTTGAVNVSLGNICNFSTSTAGTAKLSMIVFDIF